MITLKKLKENNGITLIALVITIVILLILAGISIATLGGDNGLFGRAQEAKQKSALGQAQEDISNVLNEWAVERTVGTQTFKEFLESKATGKNKAIDSVTDNEDGTFEIITNNGYSAIVKEDGTIDGDIQPVGPRPTVSNIKITLEDGTTETADESQKPGTKLKINFDSSIEGGTIKSVTPAVPYITDGTETQKKFTVVGTVNGTDYSKIVTVSVASKYWELSEEWKAAMQNNMLTKTENTTLKDRFENKVVVPAGFKITADAATVEQGIVIQDTNENQFVWVPVGTIKRSDGSTVTIALDRYSFDSSTGKETAKGEAAIYTYYTETTANSKAKSLANFKSSVATNEGYYIGRYEAGNNNNTIVCKNGATVYNNVTRDVALSKAQGMYTNTKFTSDLVNSYAWDTAIVFEQSCGTNSKYSRQNILNTSLATTGTSGDVQCNIYDMASNVLEWTTECSSLPGGPCVYRGGLYYNSDDYTSYRSGYSTSSSLSRIGFRTLLYL